METESLVGVQFSGSIHANMMTARGLNVIFKKEGQALDHEKDLKDWLQGQELHTSVCSWAGCLYCK
jgi:hypothetical protein